MAQAPIMPLFTDAIIGDTTHLSAEQFGAYMLILIATWRNNGKPLPDDDARMARICRFSVAKFRKKVRPILIEMFDVSESVWRQQRLEKEWNRVCCRLKSASAGGLAKGLLKRQNAGAERLQPISIKEASLPLKEPTPIDKPESITAREGAKSEERVSKGGRFAPLGAAMPSEKSPALRAQIKYVMLPNKQWRFLCDKHPELEEGYLAATRADGDNRPLDHVAWKTAVDGIAKLIRAERWTDNGEWKHYNGAIT